MCYCDFLRPIKSQSLDCSEQDVQDFGVRAFQLMGAVSVMGERFGITAPILMLRGSVSINTATTQSWLDDTLHVDAIFG